MIYFGKTGGKGGVKAAAKICMMKTSFFFSNKLIQGINRRLLLKNGFSDGTRYRRICFFDSFAFGFEKQRTKNTILTTKMYQCMSKKIQKRRRFSLARMYDNYSSGAQEYTEGFLITQQSVHRDRFNECYECDSYVICRFITGKSLLHAITKREIGTSNRDVTQGVRDIKYPRKDILNLNPYTSRACKTEITGTIFKGIQSGRFRRCVYNPVTLLRMISNARRSSLISKKLLRPPYIHWIHMLWTETSLKIA